MKTLFRFAGIVLSVWALAVLPAAAAVRVTFDDLPLAEGAAYWNGADGSGGFTRQGVFFTNNFDTLYFSWVGFAYSRVNDTNTPGYGNQYAVISGTGYGGTGAYAVAYDNGADSAAIELPYPTRVRGLRVNNTTYTALDMRDGSFFSKQFGGPSGNDPDWLLLTVVGRNAAGGTVGSNSLYLADYRFATNSLDYIVSDWTWLGLTNLGGEVKSLHLALSSSDTGAWGMNTPAYVAVDDLQFEGVYSLAMGDAANPHDPPVPGFTGPAGDGATGGGNRVNPLFYAWASNCASYRPAPGVETAWTNTARCLGPATGDHFDVISLGDLDAGQIASNVPPGAITVSFGRPFADRPGADFAVFENGFGTSNEVYAELAYVEVSSDGTNFARFSAESRTEGLLGPYATVAATNVCNLAGKHLNNPGDGGRCWGTPFDLADLMSDPLVKAGTVSLTNIACVRLVDIPGSGAFQDAEGRPIYDSWPTYASGGFDLEAVGLIRPVVTLGADTNRVTEQGGAGAVVTVSRDAYFQGQPLTVSLRIGGTASNGADYAAVSETVIFRAGETNRTLRIAPVADGIAEGDETVRVEAAAGSAYTVDGAPSVTVTIQDGRYGHDAWTRRRLPDRSASAVNFGTALAHLPDGRCVFGEQGNLYRQDTWEGTNWLPYANEPATNDPSCIAVWDDGTGALGAGGWSGISPIYRFAPAMTNTTFDSRTTNYNYAAVFRDADALYVVGGDYGESAVRLVALDGQTNRVLIADVSRFSAGIALGPQGELYVGDADDGRVYRFAKAQLDAAATNGPLHLTNGVLVHQFVAGGATNVLGSLAVDGRGCVWAAGWNVNGLQVYDPLTGEDAVCMPELDNGNYTVAGFTRAGQRYVAYVNLAGYGAGAAQYYGYAAADGGAEAGILARPTTAGERGPAAAAFRLLRRSWSAAQPLEVWLSVEGTASNGVDFAFVSNRVTLAAGEYERTISVAPLPDSLAEGTETVVLRLLTNGTYTAAGSGAATVWIEDQPADAWKVLCFGAGANAPQAGDAADWDGDGLPNLLEYGLGTDPTNAAGTAAIVPQAATNGAPSGFAIVYERRRDRPDVGVEAVAAADLYGGEWSAEHVVESVIAADALFETVRATLTQDWRVAFMRLKATRK